VFLKTETAGKGGFAWRLSGQKEFAMEQRTAAELTGSDDWQEMTSEISFEGELIHLRVHLPEGKTAINRITFSDADGKPLKSWNFAK